MLKKTNLTFISKFNDKGKTLQEITEEILKQKLKKQPSA